MIDTDKYEGHTEGPWEMNTNDRGQVWVSFFHPDDDNGDHHLCRITGGVEADDQLIADAPLLLAEVKRLRELLVKGSEDYTTSYTDLRNIIADVHWALTGDDAHYSQSDDARITYALTILSEVIG